jgi:hypothetical protein
MLAELTARQLAEMEAYSYIEESPDMSKAERDAYNSAILKERFAQAGIK